MTGMQPPSGEPPYAAPPRRRVPWWAWALAGCGCLTLLGLPAAVVFPVFVMARQRAMQTVCLDNVSHYARGIAMYATDYDGRLPIAQRWMDSCAGYGAVPEQRRCPAVRRYGPSAYGYAFDSGLSRKPMSAIDDPARVPDMYDSVDLRRNATDPGTSVPVPGRHLGLNSVGFVDGHAAAVRAERGERSSQDGRSSGAGEQPRRCRTLIYSGRAQVRGQALLVIGLRPARNEGRSA